MSSPVNDNEEPELEEGEIADDSNDGCSMTNGDDTNFDGLDDVGVPEGGKPAGGQGGVGADALAGADTGGAADVGGGGGNTQKRKKKVVRKVKRKIKVKKKVLRKKGDIRNTDNDNNHGPQQPQQQQQSQQQQQPQQQSNQQPQITQNHTQTPINQSHPQSLLHSQPHPLQHQHPISIQPAPQPTTQNNSQQLDLWEQQILMLQELQRQQSDQQSQILRAASTDEDLRIYPPLLGPTMETSQFLPQSIQTGLNSMSNHQVAGPAFTMANNPPQNSLLGLTTTTSIPPSTGQMLAHQHQQITNTAPTIPSSSNFGTVPNLHYSIAPTSIATSTSPNSSIAVSHDNKQPNQQANQQVQLQRHQTPSSPDDESGKSSYEAISKMLTMLRNSANVTDPSEINDDLNESSSSLDRDNSLTIAESSDQEQHQSQSGDSKTDGVEYALVPILVQGIDYTKYKLLSAYEPKFKNDPRLNQQT